MSLSSLTRTLVRLPAALTGAALAAGLVLAPPAPARTAPEPASAGLSARAGTAAPAVVPVADRQPTFPVRAAFYYGWGQSSHHATPQYGTDDTSRKRTLSG